MNLHKDFQKIARIEQGLEEGQRDHNRKKWEKLNYWLELGTLRISNNC